MTNLTPYRTADDSWDRLLQNFFGPLPTGPSSAINQANIDVWARDDAFAVSVELPGASKESIDVSVSGNEVRISAEIPEIKNSSDKVTALFRERRYGQLSRTIVLPHDVDQSQAQAKYTNGILELVLPFNPNSMPKKLAIE